MQDEIWKDVSGYEGLYQVSNLGNVKRLSKLRRHYTGVYSEIKEVIMKPYKNKSGYLLISFNLGGKIKCNQVHRLVALTFIDNPLNKPQVNHINGVKHDNRVENLEWVTISENVRHSWENKLSKRTFLNSTLAKLNEFQVIEIKKLILSGVRSCDIARKFNINPVIICNIKNKRAYNSVKID